jgi:excisionase family DNA binding protein
MPANELEASVKEHRLLTLLEVADQLRLSPHTIRAMVRKGRLKPTRITRRLLFTPNEIARLLSEGD